MKKQDSEVSSLTFYANLTYNGQPMSAEEFIELAKQNGAYSESAEIGENCVDLKNYQLRRDWLGSRYLVDIHNPIQRFFDSVHTGVCVGVLLALLIISLPYIGFALIVILALISMLF